MSRDKLKAFNALPAEAARTKLLRCCGSRRWAEALEALRPFHGPQNLLLVAERVWWGLGPDDWGEAFSCHPKIGDKKSLAAKFSATKRWAQGEQARVSGASEEILKTLARRNAEYEKKFGYIFIVCATGKSASEMLRLLGERLANEPAAELRQAAREQAKITALRLQKLLEQPT